MIVAQKNSSTSSSIRRVPFTIRFRPSVINGIYAHMQAEDESNAAAARSPLGLLFGTIEEHRVSVERFKTMPASKGETSPQGARVDIDFEQCVAASKGDRELESLGLIGWCGIRSAAQARMLDDELDFHNRHFRRVCDIALIVSSDTQAASLNFYSRWANSAMSAERHRWAAVPAPNGTVNDDPIEVSMRARVNEHYHERVYEVLHAMQEARRTGKSIAFAPKESESSSPEPTSTEEAISDESPPNLQSPDPHTTPEWLRLAKQARRTPVSSRKLWWISAAFVALAVAFALAWFYLRRAPRLVREHLPISATAKNISADLGLRIEHHGDALLLTWNQSGEPMHSATSAKLEIRDGSQFREIQLDSNEIAKGGLSYRPASSDVTLQLDVSGKQGPACSESIRILDGSKMQPGLNVIEKASEEFPDTATAVLPRAESAQARSVNGISDRRPTELTDTRRNDTSQSNRMLNLEREAWTQRNDSAVHRATVDGSRPLYIRAQPVKRVMPAGIFGQPISAPIRVDVEVRIDDAGHVTEAHAAKNPSNDNDILMSAAVSAAKEWLFQPATIGGKKISSDQMIEFRFSPESR